MHSNQPCIIKCLRFQS